VVGVHVHNVEHLGRDSPATTCDVARKGIITSALPEHRTLYRKSGKIASDRKARLMPSLRGFAAKLG
jgi:hypothetical protein